MNIGVFDSGLGGLSVFREISDTLSEYNYVYLGDNARVPYGNKSKDLIYKLTKNAVEYLLKRDCQLVILACNTSSANALRRLQREYLPAFYPDRKVLGVIRPVTEYVIDNHFKKIGVMATQATVSSESYVREIKKARPQAEVFQVACPLLVPMIEEGEAEGVSFDLILQKYTQPLVNKHIDCLILGCTHYGLIADRIKKHVPSDVDIISQGEITAEKLTEYLKKHDEIERKLTKNVERKYLATDVNPGFLKLTKLFLGKEVEFNLAKY